MLDSIILIPILIFVSTTIFCLGILSYVSYRGEQNRLKEKIKRGTGSLSLEGPEDDTSYESANVLKRYLLDIASHVGKRSKKKSAKDLSSMRKTLVRAGYRKRSAIVLYNGFKVIFAVLLPACLFLIKIFIFKGMPPVNFMTLSVLLACIGFYLPNVWLYFKTEGRKRRIIEGFPDVLDLLVVCVEAGMGLDAAIDRAGKEMKLKNSIISDELRLLSLELRAGKHRHEALKNLAMRIDLEDINSLISLLVQTDRFGTSVARALRVHSDSMRTKRYQRAEEIAAKLPVKLVFPLILFIFPSLFVTLLGPAAIKIYRSLFPYLGKG